jgi:hypothetical protein
MPIILPSISQALPARRHEQAKKIATISPVRSVRAVSTDIEGAAPMKAAVIAFRSVIAGAILVGSFFGTLTFLDYWTQQNEAGRFTSTSDERSRESTSVSLMVDPASLRQCEGPRAAKISWNASATGVQSVKIFVKDEHGQETLFTAGDQIGSASTGAWVVAGTTFVLRDGYALKHLADVSIGSDRC